MIKQEELDLILQSVHDESETYDDLQFEDYFLLAISETKQIVYSNQKLLDLTGYSDTELYSESLHLIIKDEVIEDFYSTIQCDKGDTHSYDTYIRLKDGSFFPMNATFGCVTATTGNYVYGILKDFSTMIERLHYLEENNRLLAYKSFVLDITEEVINLTSYF